MQPEQIKLVKSTWKRVLPITEQAFEMFYGRLIALNPDLNRLFITDLTRQGRKWIVVLHKIVRNLDHFDTIAPALREAGRRFANYGITGRDYDTIRHALLWTLSKGLDDFSDTAYRAWSAACKLITSTLRYDAMRAA